MKHEKTATQKSRKSTKAIRKKPTGFTDEERLAMRERIEELKADAGRGRRAGQSDGESAVLAKIAALPQPDRAMAERLHESSKLTGQPSHPEPGTACPRMPKTAMSSVSSKVH